MDKKDVRYTDRTVTLNGKGVNRGGGGDFVHLGLLGDATLLLDPAEIKIWGLRPRRNRERTEGEEGGQSHRDVGEEQPLR